ncbi:MAG TPA: hypothetical protein VFG71_01715 [Nitrospiraceae bacterium]|nr:hypothetical protein [Nitrospiraceae bacterium]
MFLRWIIASISLIAIVVLPLCGVLLTGRSIEPYLEFPPRPRFVSHAPFSWPVFLGLAVCIMAAVAPFLSRMTRAYISLGCFARAFTERARGKSHSPTPRMADHALSRSTLHERRSFPWWGWVGIIWTGVAWVVAWNRWEWLGEWQLHTFTPLWLGYIVVLNALTVSRIGSCLLQRDPVRFLLLFPVSAVFWWTFEYLNRFVENWYYVGGRELTAGEYMVLATVPFSTVLPAVLSTLEWLATYPRLSAGLEQTWRLPMAERREVGWILLVGAAGGLIGISIWPDYLFPLVWVAPLLLMVGLQLAMGQETVFAPTARGDWRLLWMAALAALICGIFWEMWNSGSLAHWEYGIPFTHRFQLFEMPLLGYAGYLPFGLECVAIVQLFFPSIFVSRQEVCAEDLTVSGQFYSVDRAVHRSNASSSFSARNTTS